MSTGRPEPKLNRQVLKEASAWFVDFRVGDVDGRARTRFDQWLRQSPEHIRAYMRIAKTYVVLPPLDPSGKIDVEQLLASTRSDDNVIELGGSKPRSNPLLSSEADSLNLGLNTARGAPGDRSSSPPQSPTREPQSGFVRSMQAWGRPPALAASVAILAAAGTLAWLAVLRPPVYSTEIGENRSIALADGSIVDLSARSKIRVSFSNARRDVELVYGQALFEVAKDSARPFLVRSDATVVRAVGTQFDVARLKSGTTVTVIEGRVAVGLSSPAPSDSETFTQSALPPILLSAGEGITVTAQASTPPRRADVAAATAWRQRQLVFSGTPLGDVVEEFNRYATRPMIIEDPTLEALRISGMYSSTNPSSLLGFLREQPDIQIIETGKEIRITRK